MGKVRAKANAGWLRVGSCRAIFATLAQLTVRVGSFFRPVQPCRVTPCHELFFFRVGSAGPCSDLIFWWAPFISLSHFSFSFILQTALALRGFDHPKLLRA